MERGEGVKREVGGEGENNVNDGDRTELGLARKIRHIQDTYTSTTSNTHMQMHSDLLREPSRDSAEIRVDFRDRRSEDQIADRLYPPPLNKC